MPSIAVKGHAKQDQSNASKLEPAMQPNALGLGPRSVDKPDMACAAQIWRSQVVTRDGRLTVPESGDGASLVQFSAFDRTVSLKFMQFKSAPSQPPRLLRS